MKKNKKILIFGFILLSILILTYSNHFNNDFHFDDSHSIVNNESIRDIKNTGKFFTDATTFSSLPANQSYRPILTLSYSFDYWISNGLNTFYFHLSNFFWYIIQLILMFFMFLKIFNSSVKHKWNIFIALFAVSWYGLHTANAETINYISARSDSYSTLFVIIAFILYIFSPLSKKYFLYFIPMIIGALIKPSAIMFAPLLFVYVLLFEKNVSLIGIFKKNNLKNILQTFIITLPAFLLGLFLYILQNKMTPKTFTPSNTSVYNYVITQPFVFLHYFKMFFFPVELSADTDWKTLETIWDYHFFIGIIFIVALLIVAVYTSKSQKTRPVSFGIFWFFLALLPSSSIIPFAEVLNDHRMFFPFVGLMLSVCWTLALLIYKFEKTIMNKNLLKFGIIFLSIIILGANAYGTYQRNKVWKTGETLWYDVTIKSPKNGRGLMNYGLSQMAKGKYEVALEYYEKALEYCPYYSCLHINLGILKNAMGHPHKAEEYFKNALKYDKNNPGAYYFYAKWLYENKQINKARKLLEKGQKLSPGHSKIKKLINKINLEEFGTPEEKIKQLINTTKNEPSCENYINLSLAYYNAEMYYKCIDACEEALKIKPNYAVAYNNICSAYNMLGKYDEAIKACEKALKIDPDFQLAKNNLNLARENKKQ